MGILHGTCFFTVGASDMLRRDRRAVRFQTCFFTVDASDSGPWATALMPAMPARPGQRRGAAGCRHAEAAGWGTAGAAPLSPGREARGAERGSAKDSEPAGPGPTHRV